MSKLAKLKKLIKEEIETAITIKESSPKSFSNEFASWFTGTVLNDVEHPKYGKHKVTPQQIKHSPGEYKDALYQAMKRAIDDGDITPDMIKEGSLVRESINESKHRPIYQIAGEISDDWGRQVNFAAKPYLQAMFSLDSINDKYILDSGRDIVARFLANAGTWRGDTAKRIKQELKNILKGKRNESTVLERKKLKLERLIRREVASIKKIQESAAQTETISKQIDEFKSNEQRIEEINASIKDSLDKLKELQTSNKNLFKRIESGMSTLELKVVKASKWVAKLETVAKYKRPTPNYSELWKAALSKVNKQTEALLLSMKNTQLELKEKETKQQLTIESGLSNFWRNLVRKLKDMFSAIKNFSRSVDELPEIESIQT